MGFERELEQERRNLPFPGRGGSRGYPQWFRQVEVDGRRMGRDPIAASTRSVIRWEHRIHPYRMTGNTSRKKLVGPDQLLLVVFFLVWPCGDADECAAFIFNNGGDVYSRQAIADRLGELQLSRKVSSTEAYQAFHPINMMKCELFFSSPPPLGIFGVPRRKFIDVDEFGISLERMNPKYGVSLKCFRVCKPGHYVRGTKLTVLFAIEPGDPRLPPATYGSVAWPRRWIQVLQATGTTSFVCNAFIEHICSNIEQHGIPLNHLDTDEHRVFLWDNLNSHSSPLVSQTVEARNGPHRFSSQPRPPYQPKYGPIEYKILDLLNETMKHIDANSSTQDLEHQILAASSRINSFDATFDHCGYA